MGIFSFLERAAGDSKLSTDWTNLSSTGANAYSSGTATTDEGLSGLRGLNSQYQGMLSNPLGTAGNSIFARARGALSDDYTRNVNGGAARTAQLATQSGGTLTPEQIAAQNASTTRDAGANLFSGENSLAEAKATMSLDQTNKLYDRMQSIQNSIVSVGQDDKMRGLQTMLGALTGRTNRMQSIAKDVLGPW